MRGLSLCLLLATGCSGPTVPECAGGELLIGTRCATLCITAAECPGEEICGTQGYCLPNTGEQRCTSSGQCSATQQCDRRGVCVALADLPRIDRVIGDRADGTVDAALRVEGARLAGTVAALEDGTSAVALAACAPSNDNLLLLDLPDDLGPGEYTLTITNQDGTCSQTMQLLQGSADTPAQVLTKLTEAIDGGGALPGGLAGDITSTVQTQAEGGGVSRSIRVQGVEQVDSTNNGLFVVAIDRVTHVVETGTINGAPVGVNYSSVPTDISGLAALLNSIDPTYLVVLASRGDITAMAANGPLGTAIQRLGGTVSFASLAVGDTYVLVGIGGLGARNGLEMVSDTASGPAAVATLLIDAAATGISGSINP